MKITVHSALCVLSLVVLSLNLPAIAADRKQTDREKLRAEQKVRKEEVLGVAKELTAALVARNVAAVDRMLSKDYVEVFEEDVLVWDGRRAQLPAGAKKVPGRKRTRDDLLSGLKSGTLKITSLQTTHEEVAIQSNPAFVGGELVMFVARIIEKSSHNGKDTSGEFIITRNYAKQDGKWVCTGSNLNPLIPKP
jgi:hypothetical protein